MAVTQNITMGVDIRQNKQALSKMYGKWYPEVHHRGTLSSFGLAKHMSDHGSLVTEEVLRLVLGQLSKCIPELLAQGIGIKLDGLGIFFPTVQSIKGGAATIEEASQLGAAALVEGVHIRFRPEQEDLRDLTFKAMKKKCSLTLENVVTTTETTGEDGKPHRIRTYQPVADYLLDQNGGDGGDGEGDGEEEPEIRP